MYEAKLILVMFALQEYMNYSEERETTRIFAFKCFNCYTFLMQREGELMILCQCLKKDCEGTDANAVFKPLNVYSDDN